MKLNINNKEIILGPWEPSPDSILSHQRKVENQEPSWLTERVLLQPVWGDGYKPYYIYYVYFEGKTLSPFRRVFSETFGSRQLKYGNLELQEAKELVDNFMIKINNLKAFL